MLEQSKLNGQLFYSVESVENQRAKLATKSIDIPQVKFGQPTKISIHRNIRTDKFLLIKELSDNDNEAIIYNGNGDYLKKIKPNVQPDDDVFNAYYGIARFQGILQPYFIKNQPLVSIDNVPDWNHIQLPPTLIGYPYQQTFSYDDRLIELLGDLPATNTDRYKRPLNPYAINNRIYVPTSIKNVETTFADIAKYKRHFPIVVMLNQADKDTKYACLDLEPSATDADRKIVEQYEAYYVESTPRGGKHYLVKAAPDDHAFKYRLTPNLEVQVDCQITFYGINGQFLNDNPTVAHFKAEDEVGHKVHHIKDAKKPDNLDEQVQMLIDINQQIGQQSKARIHREYIADDDVSHADFTALVHIYMTDIKPFIDNLDQSILPWILAGYAKTMIPYRTKHDDMRVGVPYLVFLAEEIINTQSDMKGKIY